MEINKIISYPKTPKPKKRKAKKWDNTKWLATVQEMLIRDDYTCQYTNKQYQADDHALHPHHRIFKSQGGKDDLENLASCNWSLHAEHGKLKDRPLLSENGSMKKINELKKKYKHYKKKGG